MRKAVSLTPSVRNTQVINPPETSIPNMVMTLFFSEPNVNGSLSFFSRLPAVCAIRTRSTAAAAYRKAEASSISLKS